MTAEETEKVTTAEQILSSSNSNFKSIDVFKEVDPVIDEGNLTLNDLQPLDLKKLGSEKEAYLSALARENTQLLFNKIWQLSIERIDNTIVAKLPAPTSLLPREKAIPKPKPPTKWEKYAKDKGIQKKKRGRMIWDEQAKSWKPRYGYKRGKDDTKDWCLEVPENTDPYQDQFEKKVQAKKERVAKNELQRLRNIARNQKGGTKMIMSTQFKPTGKKDKERVTKEIGVAKLSTASLGKFQEKLPKEKEDKKTGKKRKFEPVAGNISSEKKKALEIWEKINKPGKLDTTKAVNKQLANEQITNSSKKSSGAGRVKNKRFRKGKQAAVDKKKTKSMKFKRKV